MATKPNTTGESQDSQVLTQGRIGREEVQATLSVELARRFDPEFLGTLPASRPWPKGRGV